MAFDWWKTTKNVASNPITAIKNVSKRYVRTKPTVKTAQKDTSWWDDIKYALTPQTAYADYGTPQSQPMKFPTTKSVARSKSLSSVDGSEEDTNNPINQEEDHIPNTAGRYPTTPLSSPSKAPTTTLPSYTWWMGNRYDMNNPNEQQSYVNSKKNWYDTNYDRSLTENKNNYDVQMSELGTNLEDLQKAYENRNRGIGSYYQRIAPNIYQSAEGQSLKESEEGMVRSTGEVAAEKKRLGDWWNQYQGDLLQQKQDFYDSLNNTLEEQAAIDYQNQIEQGMKPTYKRPASVGENVTKGMQGFNAPSAPLTQGQQRQQGTQITAIQTKIINGQSLTPQELQLAQELGIA